jgi:iron complex transport system substrate-binding protein
MPCGLYAAEAEREARRHRRRLEALGAREVHAVDAASSFSRPGPRLADGIELLAHLLHPELIPAPGSLESRRAL